MNNEVLTGVVCDVLWCPEVQMQDVFVRFDGEQIARIEPWAADAPAPEGALDLRGKNVRVCPGLIDIHVHGCGGGDFLDNTDDALEAISAVSARGGATSVIATTTISIEDTDMELFRSIISRLKNTKVSGARYAGLHLEGPFINPERRGSFADAYMRPINIKNLNEILDVCGDFLRKITISPEIENAWELVDVICKRTNAEVSLGHSIASYEKAEEFYQHPRVRQATHCFNAMMPLHHRAPGILGASLLDRRVTTEIIPDGFHLSGPIIDMIYRLKGRDKVVIITDGNAATGMPDGVPVRCIGGEAFVKDDAVYLPNGTLAGSNLSMAKALMKAQRLGKVPFSDALTMCTVNAAQAIRMQDVMGNIEPGKFADLCVLDSDDQVALTIRDGKVVYQA